MVAESRPSAASGAPSAAQAARGAHTAAAAAAVTRPSNGFQLARHIVQCVLLAMAPALRSVDLRCRNLLHHRALFLEKATSAAMRSLPGSLLDDCARSATLFIGFSAFLVFCVKP